MSEEQRQIMTYDGIPQNRIEEDVSYQATIIKIQHKYNMTAYQHEIEPVYAKNFARINELRSALGIEPLTKEECHIDPHYFISEEANDYLLGDYDLPEGTTIRIYKEKSEKAPIPVYSTISDFIIQLMDDEIEELEHKLNPEQTPEP